MRHLPSQDGREKPKQSGRNRRNPADVFSDSERIMKPDVAAARGNLLVILALAVVTFLAYGHLLGNGFINFDDNIYIFKNRWVQQGLTGESIAWAFSFADKEGTYWQPLTWLSLMLNHELFALNPVGYHMVNLLLHIANACLLFTALNRMTGRFWQSAFVAALFALHPLDVESVAWATEQKSVLSSLLWMLALIAYSRYTAQPTRLRYLPVCLCLALGLMAKSMLVTLPCVLLLLDVWPLRRAAAVGGTLTWRTLALEKVPLLGLSALSAVISIYSVPEQVVAETRAMPTLATRLGEALVSYVCYLGKLFLPLDLIVYYPPQASYPLWQVAGSLLIMSALTGLCLWQARRRPWLIIGWLWYLGVLFPVSGLMRTGLWPAMADRFTYLPQIGIFIMIAWSAGEVLERFVPQRMRTPAGSTAAGVVLVLVAFGTWVQAGYWKDSGSLFSRVLRIDPDNYIGHANLADHLFYGGKVRESLPHYQEAVRVAPERAKARRNLGAALAMLERYDEAIVQYLEALRLEPDMAEAHYGLGVSYGPKGELAKATEHLEEAVKLNPSNPAYHTDLARAYYLQGEGERAAREVRIAQDLESAVTNAK